MVAMITVLEVGFDLIDLDFDVLVWFGLAEFRFVLEGLGLGWLF